MLTATLSAGSTISNPVFHWYDADGQPVSGGANGQLDLGQLPSGSYTYEVGVSGDGVCETPAADRKQVSFTISRQSTVADIMAGNAAICSGSSVIINASSTTVEAPVFRWYSDAALTDLLHTGAEFTSPVLSASTEYYVTVEGTGVCEGEARTVAVTVGERPEAPTILSTDPGTCAGSSITLQAEAAAGTEILWYDQASGGDPLFTGAEWLVEGLNATTTYYAEARYAGASCASTTRTPVTISVIPQLSAPVVSCQERTPTTVTFTWAPVDGALGYEVNVNDAGWEEPSSGATGTSHLVENAEPTMEYEIRVRAISAEGECGNSESQAVACEVENFNDLYIPNAFTPNGDGRNDFFEVLGTYQSLDLKIYNQWGNKVFETQTKGHRWDGTYRGERLPSGVYVYFVEVRMADGSKVFRKGSISLIR